MRLSLENCGFLSFLIVGVWTWFGKPATPAKTAKPAKPASQTNQQQRYRTFQQAEAILMDESPIIPIYTYTRVLLKHPQLQGWHPNILDQHPYKHVYLQEPK